MRNQFVGTTTNCKNFDDLIAKLEHAAHNFININNRVALNKINTLMNTIYCGINLLIK